MLAWKREGIPNADLEHPSVALTGIPNLDAQRQALEYGVKVWCSCWRTIVRRHWQRGFWEEEHLIYSEALAIVLAGGWRIEGRRVVVD